ncbi:MAG: hypothetical protein MK179_23090, partial [Pirellulaceae bacterium]|nr:hypothetical protein [Pirellulaceae bacterium]
DSARLRINAWATTPSLRLKSRRLDSARECLLPATGVGDSPQAPVQCATATNGKVCHYYQTVIKPITLASVI